MQTKSRVRNGVDVIRLEETIGAIKDDPGLADFRFRAKNQWIDGGHNRSTIKDFYGCRIEDTSRQAAFVVDADEPEVLLGQDNGANPVEYVLHALAACLTTSIVYHAAARGIAIESVESEIEGNLDARGFLGLSDEVYKGFKNIDVTFTIKSDAPAEQLEELAKFSPVFDTMTRAIPVRVKVQTS